MGCIFGTGGGSVGVLWEAVFGTEGAYCGWHFGTGVVVWVYCGKQFLVLRVCTVGRIFGTGVVVWVYCGKQFLVLRVCTVDGIFGTGVVVWVYCGKQFFGTEGVYCG